MQKFPSELSLTKISQQSFIFSKENRLSKIAVNSFITPKENTNVIRLNSKLQYAVISFYANIVVYSQ